MRAENEPAYILEARAYRETSLLLDVLTREHGRLAMVARGVRGGTRSQLRRRALLEPLQPLRMAFSGRGEVLTLTAVESDGATVRPLGNALFSALYVSELLQRLTGRGDPVPALFDRYAAWLAELAMLVAQADDGGAGPEDASSKSGPSAILEWSLRRFERDLLEILGYGLALECDSDTGAPIDPQADYAFDPAHGARLWGKDSPWPRTRGAVLLAWSSQSLPESETAAMLKQLARQVIRHHLGGAEPRAWKLAVQWRANPAGRA